jgi:hypothetical protein
MSLKYAIDRLTESGWHPSDGSEVESLADGRQYPSVMAVQSEFSRAGLVLSIKHNLMFSCYRATWCPLGEHLDPDVSADHNHGTVVAACEREAAVYAFAQLRTARAEQLLGVSGGSADDAFATA